MPPDGGRRSPALPDALAALEAHGEARLRDGLARYGIVTADRVIGVSMANIQKVAKGIGRDHDLAAALWETRVYEARLMTAYVDDPALITPEQMDRWTRAFDNWGVCDTLCFSLFDRTPHAFAMVDRWADDGHEYVKRTAFALLASLALHDRKCGDAPFLDRLPLIEAAATDARNFVWKGVSWALRGIGRRKSEPLRAASQELADRLASSTDKTARRIGKEAEKAFARATGKPE
ncbi:MAG: DNA alkylation repair protein [Allosphingosinicella sp.]